MSLCQFIIAAPGLLHCTVCNVPQTSEAAPANTFRTCRRDRPSVQQPTSSDCCHRGPRIGTTPCEKAGCRAQIKVYSCALLQECTLSENVPSKPCCGTCERREPPPT